MSGNGAGPQGSVPAAEEGSLTGPLGQGIRAPHAGRKDERDQVE